MRLSFSVDISPQGVDEAEVSSPSLSHGLVTPITVQSAADAATLMLEPKTLAVVSKAVDGGIDIRSTTAAAETVAAYYAPLEQALRLVDSLLGVASKFADVCIFHDQGYP
jgi:hypothetical protein